MHAKFDEITASCFFALATRKHLEEIDNGMLIVENVWRLPDFNLRRTCFYKKSRQHHQVFKKKNHNKNNERKEKASLKGIMYLNLPSGMLTKNIFNYDCNMGNNIQNL